MGGAPSRKRLQRDTVWRLLDYLLNSVIFILIGLQFPTIVREMKIPVAQMIFIGVAISLVVSIAVRFLWVFPMASLERCFFQEGIRTTCRLVSLSWPRGRACAVWYPLLPPRSLPLSASIGEAFPHRHIILFLTFCVIFTTWC